jgi:hypothetical protein
VILPLSFILCAGWLEWADLLPGVKKRQHLAGLALLGFLLLTALYAWYSLAVRLT